MHWKPKALKREAGLGLPVSDAVRALIDMQEVKRIAADPAMTTFKRLSPPA